MSDKTAERQLRAYIGPIGGSVLLKNEGNNLYAFVQAQNNGQTPAYSVERYINFDVGPFQPHDPFPDTGLQVPVSYMGPAMIYGWSAEYSVAPAALADIIASRQVIRLWVRIEFKDIFRKKTRISIFKYSMSGKPVAVTDPRNQELGSGWALRPDAQGHETNDD